MKGNHETGIEFRTLRSDDLPTLATWFGQPAVARWWNMPTALDAVVAKYQPRIDGLEPTIMWIVEFDGVPGGLIQSYRHADYPAHDAAVGIPDAVGIDYLLDDAHRGRGLGARAIRVFALRMLDHYPGTTCCVATPGVENEPSWRCLERAGFRRDHECHPPDERPAYAYVFHRTAVSE